MTKALNIPKERRGFAPREARSVEAQSVEDGAPSDRRDAMTGLQSDQPGDADANLDQMGRYGNLKQNMTARMKVQDR